MNALDLARWQFAITTIYHFLMVPITLGLSMLVAGFQTAWYRTGKDAYLRATKFWGKLFLINFAMGVVTGIVQEFQFGMNWSEYSRYVGDIFGAPLAMEGLIAFFLESTFLGLWIFGWDRLPKKVHLATIWIAAIGTSLSAYFILAANSWMQHPVGYSVNPDTGRAELNDIGAVLTNSTALVTFPHTMAGAFMTAGAFMLGIAAFYIVRNKHESVMRPSLKVGAITVLVAGAFVAVTGHFQAQVMTEQQPMKMAAAEAVWDSQSNVGFSLFTIGSLDGREEVFSIRIPGLTSFLATNSFDGKVEGLNDVQADLENQFGPTDYTPNIPVTYWSFRLMIGAGALAALFAALALVVDAPRTFADFTVVRPRWDRRDLPALAGELVRLDFHRDGSPALGGLRLALDGKRCLVGGVEYRGVDLDDHAHLALRRAGRRGVRPCCESPYWPDPLTSRQPRSTRPTTTVIPIPP